MKAKIVRMKSEKQASSEVDAAFQALEWAESEKAHINKLHQQVIGKAFGLLFMFAFMCGGFAVVPLAATEPIIRFSALSFAIICLLIIRLRLAPAMRREITEWFIEWYALSDDQEEQESEEAHAG